MHTTVTVHITLPVGMIKEDVMAEGSHCEVSTDSVERGHLVDISLQALFVPAVPATVHEGKAHAQIEAHHLYELKGKEVSLWHAMSVVLSFDQILKCHYMP